MRILCQRNHAHPLTTEGNTLVGYGSLWDVPYKVVEKDERGKVKRYTEVFKRGAFRTLDNDVFSFFDHNQTRLLGRTSAGTLRLTEDDKGLRYEVDLPNHAADVREMVERGDVRGASIQFVIRGGGEKWDGDRRSISHVALLEVGPVIMPASPTTTAELRGLTWYEPIDWMRMRIEIEKRK